MLAEAEPQPDPAAEFDSAAHHPPHSRAPPAVAAQQPADPDPHPAAWSQAELTWGVTMPAEFVPMTARVVTRVGFGPRQLTNRPTRPIKKGSRKAAVSPKPSSMHIPSATASSGQKQNHPVSIRRQASFAASQDRTDCLSAQPETRPKSMSDSLLHDLCCDCPISPTPIGPQAAQNCVSSQGDLRPMVLRNVS